MATVYYKLAGEILTAAEASEAQTAFEEEGTMLAGYEFKHWSSSSSTDQEVTALNPGGAGVTVTGNATYYPVVGIQAFLNLSISGGQISYEWVRQPQVAQVYSNFPGARVLMTSGTSANSYSYDIIATQSNITYSSGGSGSVAQNTSQPNVNFGRITLNSITSASQNYSVAYQKTSDVDGYTYNIKIVAEWVANQTCLQFFVYRVVDGTPTQYATSDFQLYATVFS